MSSQTTGSFQKILLLAALWLIFCVATRPVWLFLTAGHRATIADKVLDLQRRVDLIELRLKSLEQTGIAPVAS
jgi:hypothetical protein